METSGKTGQGPKKILGSSGSVPVGTTSDSTQIVGGALSRVKPAPGLTVREELIPVIKAALQNRSEIQKIPGVITVRAGYKFIDGKITSIPCIVVAVKRKLPRGQYPDGPRLKDAYDGVPVDVAPADPYEMMAYHRSSGAPGAEAFPAVSGPELLIDQIQAEGEESQIHEAARVITYEPPPNAELNEVTGAMSVTCHVSPDSGWKVLEPFLKNTENSVCLGMYDFTAPHIYKTVRSILRDSQVEFKQTLGPGESLPGEDEADSTKAEDFHEDEIIRKLRQVAGDRFQSVFAAVGSGRTFASAYHIKVAVRDKKSFWLSSGNWQSSNQPNIDFLVDDADRQLIAKYNREWHVVVDHPGLAKKFQGYLDWDFKTASEQAEAGWIPEAAPIMPVLLMPADGMLFEERAARSIQVFVPKKFTFTSSNPLRIQPILTPDNYMNVILKLLREEHKPKKKLYFQNQSLNPIKNPTEEFAELMRLLVDYSNDVNIDVRLIFRNIGPIRKKLESLKAVGFNMECVRTQSGCHTKGIIIDSEVVLVGSHNFTNDGTQFNRDASLLFYDAAIAKYYEDIFLHDWDRLARSTIREESAPQLLGDAEAEGTGYVRVPWESYDEED